MMGAVFVATRLATLLRQPSAGRQLLCCVQNGLCHTAKARHRSVPKLPNTDTLSYLSCCQNSLQRNICALPSSTFSTAIQSPKEDVTDELDTSSSDIFNHLNPDDSRKLKILQLEYDVWLSAGRAVPTRMTDSMWLEILREKQTVFSRRKLYKFWCARERKRQSGQKKKEAKRQLKLVENVEPIDGMPCQNRFLQRYSDTRVRQQIYVPNMAFSMIHGPHLVFDLGFHNQMTKQELNNLVDQLIQGHGYNYLLGEPYHFHFCNVAENSPMEEVLYKRFTGLKDLLCTVSDQNYLDFYPKESLVYLSPNAPDLLETFDYNDTYILGGIVDKANEDPLTFAKAKREKIRTKKLPLDKYLKWKSGSKSLTLDQMVKIMCTLKDTESDWNAVLEHVPKRKIQSR